jgi:hypothetical protein
MRGTVIVAKDRYLFDSVVTSTTGRAMAVVYHGVLLINVYVPSGTALRSERELFFNTELPFLFRTDHRHIFCVLQPTDVLDLLPVVLPWRSWSEVFTCTTRGHRILLGPPLRSIMRRAPLDLTVYI